MIRTATILRTLAGLGAFVVMANLFPAQVQAQGKIAATVNGEAIPSADVERLLKQDHPQVHPPTNQEQHNMRQMALDMLISDTLMRQFLAKNGPKVSPAEMAKEMSQIHEALAKKKQTFAEFLAESSMTEKQLKEDILVRLQWKAYVANRIPDSLIKPYYETNKVFFDKVFVRASHILLKFPEKATEQQKLALLEKIQAIRQEVTSGKIDFGEAARKYSDCPSNKKGGDIGHFPYKFVVAEPFAKAAFALNVGDVSAPVETEFGYHILKVTERTKGDATTFDEVKEIVRDVYAQEVELYQNIIAEQRKVASIKITGS